MIGDHNLLKNRKTVAEINDEKTIQEPRWIIMYLDYNMAEDKRLTGKEIMLKWCPDGAADKSKITFASSSKGLTDALDVSFIVGILGASSLTNYLFSSDITYQKLI